MGNAAIPSAVERVAEGLFLAEHPKSEWHGGRACGIWWARAHAAIAAMREPSAEVATAINQAAQEHKVDPGLLAHVWFRAIDAALAWPTAADLAQAMSAGTAETRSGSGRQPASAVASGDAPDTGRPIPNNQEQEPE